VAAADIAEHGAPRLRDVAGRPELGLGIENRRIGPPLHLRDLIPGQQTRHRKRRHHIPSLNTKGATGAQCTGASTALLDQIGAEEFTLYETIGDL
jgi:hypothetical protein